MLHRIVDTTLSICIAAPAYKIVILLPTIFWRCFYPVLFCNCSRMSKFLFSSSFDFIADIDRLEIKSIDSWQESNIVVNCIRS